MRSFRRVAFVISVALNVAISAAAPPVAIAATTTGSATAIPLNGSGPEVSPAVHYDKSPPLRDLTAANHEQRGEHREIPRHHLPNGPAGNASDPVVQATAAVPAAAPLPGLSFDGIGQDLGPYFVCCAPPDTNGAVGPNHYVQIVNHDLAVFTKTGALLLGPVANNTLWSGFGGGCQTNNDGDPLAVYDRIADRWVISQFSVTTAPRLECVAVSVTPDPTGAYYRYAFSYGNDFPDYPKMGVWSDAYYLSFNMFNAAGTAFLGAKACAYDRTRMLAGQAATQQCFQLSNTWGGLLPSDLDGSTLPPAGAPNDFVALDATVTSNLLRYWTFHVDWTTPASSTFAGPTSVSVATYTKSCRTFARLACIPQGGPGSSQLESLADRLMYRLAYRNLGDHSALVVNHTVEVGAGATLRSGVRWYELRPDAVGNLTLLQQGTYAPDDNWRWMGSAAMNRSGDIALGYSVSSPSLFPQIHFTGRLAADLPGMMTQGEGVLIDGTGAQTGGLARWGDYSSLTIDPVDDCTFWYTNEYLRASGSFNWSTRIGSFKLSNCGAADFALGVSPSSFAVTAGSPASYTAAVTPSGGFTGAVTLSATGLPLGAAATFSPNPTTSTSTVGVTTSSTTPPGSYPITITGVSGSLTHGATAALVVNAAPDFSISATPSSATVSAGASASYTVNIVRSGGFAGSVALSTSGLPAGASATYSPNPAAGSSSALSVVTAGSTLPGSYAVTITGMSGSLTRTAPVTLVVTAAAPPTVTGIAPPSGSTAGGDALTITGTGFASGASITIDGNPATAVMVVNPTTINATTPPGIAGPVDVVVTNLDLQAGTCFGCYTYLGSPAPTVTNVSPSSGTSAGGDTLTITGTGFASGASVTIDGAPATTVTVVNATTISAATPPGIAGPVNVLVTNVDLQSGTCVGCFTYVDPPAPTVTGIAPPSGSTAGGSVVTITGTGFASGASVTIDGAPGTAVTVVNPTTISAMTPPGIAGPVDVVVTNLDLQSGMCLGCFTYVEAAVPARRR